MAEIIIRRAKAADLPEVTKLWKEMMGYPNARKFFFNVVERHKAQPLLRRVGNYLAGHGALLDGADAVYGTL